MFLCLVFLCLYIINSYPLLNLYWSHLKDVFFTSTSVTLTQFFPCWPARIGPSGAEGLGVSGPAVRSPGAQGPGPGGPRAGGAGGGSSEAISPKAGGWLKNPE